MKKNVVANWIAIALSTVSTGIYAQELINNSSFDGNTLTENSQSHTYAVHLTLFKVQGNTHIDPLSCLADLYKLFDIDMKSAQERYQCYL